MQLVEFAKGRESDKAAPDKRGIEDNSKIIFLISQRKHML